MKRFYYEAVGRPRGYVYIDCHPLQKTKYYVYRNLFPDEGVTETLPVKRQLSSNSSNAHKKQRL